MEAAPFQENEAFPIISINLEFIVNYTYFHREIIHTIVRTKHSEIWRCIGIQFYRVYERKFRDLERNKEMK